MIDAYSSRTPKETQHGSRRTRTASKTARTERQRTEEKGYEDKYKKITERKTGDKEDKY